MTWLTTSTATSSRLLPPQRDKADACLRRCHDQSHDRMDFPDGKAPIVIASVGARVSAGVTDVVKGSSNHRDDWMSRYVH
jgi:hypothetical protein